MRGMSLDPLGSAHIGPLLGAVRCLICDWDNSRGLDYCRRCQAPLGLAEEADRIGHAPCSLAVVGAPGAGTTTWLGLATDLLARGVGPYRLELHGASSLLLPQETTSDLGRHRFPEHSIPDPQAWSWVHSRLWGGGRPISPPWLIPDLPGEALLASLEQRDDFPIVPAVLQRARGIILCLNRSELASGNESDENLAIRTLAYLAELSGSRRRHDRRPIAVVLLDHGDEDDGSHLPGESSARTSPTGISTPRWSFRRKSQPWPGAPSQRDARLRLRSVAPQLAQVLDHRHGPWDAFPVRVSPVRIAIRSLGGTRYLPLRIEPTGLAAPLVWMAFQLESEN